MGGYSFHPIGADCGLLSNATSPDARRLAVVDGGAGSGFLERCGCLLGRTGCRTDPVPDSQSHLVIHPDSHRNAYPNTDRLAGIHSHTTTLCYGGLDLQPFANRLVNYFFNRNHRYKPARDLGNPDRTPEHVHCLPLFHAYGVPHTHLDLDEDPHPSAAPNMDTLIDPHAAPHAHSHVDPHADADSKPDTHLHPNANAHAHTDADPNANAVKGLMNLHML
jgi:hypothetical protein